MASDERALGARRWSVWTRIDLTEAHRALSHPALRRRRWPHRRCWLADGQWSVRPAIPHRRGQELCLSNLLYSTTLATATAAGASWTVSFFFAGDYQRPVALNIPPPPPLRTPLQPQSSPSLSFSCHPCLYLTTSTKAKCRSWRRHGVSVSVCTCRRAATVVCRWPHSPSTEKPPGGGTEGGGRGRERQTDRQTD